jgi:hypothetical protein
MPRGAILAATVLCYALAIGSPAHAAEFGIVPGSVTVEPLDAAGQPELRAGAHPDRLAVDFAFVTEGTGTSVRDLAIEFPPGLSGDLSGVVGCPRQVFDEVKSESSCPPTSKVGKAELSFVGFSNSFDRDLFSIQPAPNQLGVLGFALLQKLPMQMTLRPDDMGLSVSQESLSQLFSLESGHIELWGVPADHEGVAGQSRRPFLTLPTTCGEPLRMTLRARSWQPGAAWQSATATSGAPLIGCEDVPFDPRVSLELTDPRADTPSGAAVEMTVPQNEDPDGQASSPPKRIDVSLPAGLSISPAAANGLSACSDAQLSRDSPKPATCPRASRIGSVELRGPAIREPIEGGVYVGQERPGDRFRLFMVAKGPGVEAKLEGSLRPDGDGHLRAHLTDLPQLPFERISLRFDGGSRALLATPLECGPLSTTARFQAYAGGSVGATANTSIARGPGGSPCPDPPPFKPDFSAGTSPAKAGRATAFHTTLHRVDGEQSPERFSVTFPPGLSAELGSVARCEPAATSSCPATARIGSAVVEVGSGPSPAAIPGDIFLTGPYRRAPFGLLLRFHAALGPFDLGSFSTRAALRIAPRTGRVTVETDSLPEVFEGIPLRFQTIGLDIDRPGFLHNPTSCGPSTVAADIRSTSGVEAKPTSPFFVRGCESLRFHPRLAMALQGRSEMHRHGHPGVRIALRAPSGSAALRNGDISLPGVLAFDASHLKQICSLQDALEGACPAESRVGRASARTPLLDKPLSGSIYVTQPRGSGLPDLWTSIRGLGVRLDVRSSVAVEQGQVHTRLAGLPDVPLSKFAMTFDPGAGGVLTLTHDPCRGARSARATVGLEAWNEAYRFDRVGVRLAGCGKAHRG